jgi:hypothetical protein
MTTQKHSIRLLIVTILLCDTVPAQARGPWRASETNTRGWQLMTPEERIAHQARVRSFTDHDVCETYRTQHHALMTERARQRGVSLNEGAHDFCDHLKSHGTD